MGQGARGPGRMARGLLGAFVALVFVYLLLPISVIVPMSFSNQLYLSFPPPGWSVRWYRGLLENPVWLDATWSSGLWRRSASAGAASGGRRSAPPSWSRR